MVENTGNVQAFRRSGAGPCVTGREPARRGGRVFPRCVAREGYAERADGARDPVLWFF
jgi:hypothetical protein